MRYSVQASGCWIKQINSFNSRTTSAVLVDLVHLYQSVLRDVLKQSTNKMNSCKGCIEMQFYTFLNSRVTSNFFPPEISHQHVRWQNMEITSEVKVLRINAFVYLLIFSIHLTLFKPFTHVF